MDTCLWPLLEGLSISLGGRVGGGGGFIFRLELAPFADGGRWFVGNLLLSRESVFDLTDTISESLSVVEMPSSFGFLATIFLLGLFLSISSSDLVLLISCCPSLALEGAIFLMNSRAMAFQDPLDSSVRPKQGQQIKTQI